MLSRRQLRVKVVKALYAHLKSESDTLVAGQKNLLAAIDKNYDLYLQMLALPVAVTAYAAERIEAARGKKLPTAQDLNPNMRLVENAAVRAIEASEAFSDLLRKRTLGWNTHPELIRGLYKQLSESNYYQTYMTAPEAGFDADKTVWMTFFERELQECEALDDALEEMSILWDGDLGFVLTMVIRTFQNMRPSHAQVRLLPPLKDESDREFAKRLFSRTLVEYSARMELIERFTRNWDVDRIVFMDNLILATAITELIEDPEIPVKVTLDEYIDIAKFYSTPGSGPFINGVLDKVVGELTEKGLIRKTGRGLL